MSSILQSLTFGSRCKSLATFSHGTLRGTSRAARQPADTVLGCRTARRHFPLATASAGPWRVFLPALGCVMLRSGLARCHALEQSAEVDLWLQVQLELARCHADALADMDLWLGRCLAVEQPAVLDPWSQSPARVCRCLPPSTLGQGFFQSLGDVALTSSLQTLTFGYDDEIKRAACSPGPLASDST